MSTRVKIESSRVSIKIELDSTRNSTRHYIMVKSLTQTRLNSTQLDFNPG
jgi:hypothetical protein